MARRRKTSPAEDLMELVSMLPWWAGVGLAIGSYGLLHHWAGQPVTATAKPGQMGALLTQSLGHTLATFGQYIVPLICLAGAGASAWRRKVRQRLVSDAAASPAADALNGMSWQQFESLVGEGFRLQGYRVAETGGGGADGGIDLVLTKGTEKFLVQCKQWRAFKVGVTVVRELYGVMAARGAAGGMVVTSGRFTEEAVAFAKGRNIQLIDGTRLHGLIRAARGAAPVAQVAEPTFKQEPGTRPLPASIASPTPSCPLCDKPMLRRVAKRGANAGGEFWGCAGYPACRGTRAIG